MTDDSIEAKSWALVQAYLSSASPEQWHLYAARSNYDGNTRALQWLVDRPELDAATARLVYWYLGAAWYVQYADLADARDETTWRLLRSIEERVEAGFYRDGGIWFDPHYSGGGGPGDYPDVPVRRPIPAFMLTAVGTELVEVESDPDGFDEGLPIEVVEALDALHGG